MDVIFLKSIFLEYLFNVEWFYKFVYRILMVLRDIWLFFFLYLEYDKKRSVRCLVEWVFKVNFENVYFEIISFWVLILGWFLFVLDCRVRDNVIKVIVRLMEFYCNLWFEILDKFYKVDDDYIFERLFVVVYGLFVRFKNI